MTSSNLTTTEEAKREVDTNLWGSMRYKPPVSARPMSAFVRFTCFVHCECRAARLACAWRSNE